MTSARIRYCFILLLTILTLACSSKPKMEEHLTQKFTTQITDNDSKQFALVVWQKAPQHKAKKSGNQPKQRGQRNQKQRPQTRGVQESNRTITAYLEEQLELTIEKTNFCRTGYFVIEQFIGKRSYIRGECNESATKNDRKTFG